ncbi:MAG: glycosyltransferase [Fulvivirga sp.]|nr:glycosyltransferase [Fulvivirga sp.]
MQSPLVSVICVCHNQAEYIKETVQSVLQQSYPHVELIIVDDASTDGSKDVIHALLKQHPDIQFVDFANNVGLCAAFNAGLKKAKGQYVVDLSADDVFMHHRLERQVKLFQELPADYGVIYTNTIIIGQKGEKLWDHAAYLKKHRLVDKMPQGDIYCDVLRKYFISPPSMLVKKVVMDDIGGYDESLAYEDFDFWVRSSRKWKYAYLDEALTRVRKVKNSLSSSLYQPGDQQLHSTYLVCRKAQSLNKNKSEDDALAERVRYEIRQAVFTNNPGEARLFYSLLKELKSASMLYKILLLVSRLKLPLATVRKIYRKLRYQR